LTTLAIDFAVIAIILFCGWRGYRNGLIRGVFGVVTLIVALIIANIVASAYSEEVTDVLSPFVGGVVDSTINKMIGDDEDGDDLVLVVEYEPVDHENDTEEFKTVYTALRNIGLPKAAAISIAENASENDTKAMLTDFVSERLSSVLAFVALFGIAFLLLAIIFAVVGNLISFVFSLPGLKLVDIFAGIAFGLAKGFLIVLTLATIVRYFGLLALPTLEDTTVLNYFVNNNLIANMLGI